MKVKQIITNPIDNGIFTRLGELFPQKYPWADEYCDYMYLARSGNKTISPLIEGILPDYDPTAETQPISQGALTILVSIIDRKYGHSWERLFDLTQLEYDPIKNYDMSETETPNITRQTDTETATDIETTAAANSAADIYGFNSETPVPNAQSLAGSTQRVKGSKNGNTESRTETESGTREITRSGNIGVTTTQRLIESEIELWKWTYLDTIFAQLDDLIACPLYEY